MSIFEPGKHLFDVFDKDGKQFKIRNLKWEDVDEFTRFMNELSKEDTYDLFAGEFIYKGEEAHYLNSVFYDSEFMDNITIGLFDNDRLAGFCGTYRDKRKRSRSSHVGIFHISIGREYRGKGLGFILSSKVIELVPSRISNIRQLELDCFGNNPNAINLYKKLGFVEVGRVPERFFHRGIYVDMVLMQKKIL